jgi:hypothetical protein
MSTSLPLYCGNGGLADEKPLIVTSYVCENALCDQKKVITMRIKAATLHILGIKQRAVACC